MGEIFCGIRRNYRAVSELGLTLVGGGRGAATEQVNSAGMVWWSGISVAISAVRLSANAQQIATQRLQRLNFSARGGMMQPHIYK